MGPGPNADPNFSQRLDGYQQALREHDLPDYHITTHQFGLHEVADTTAAALEDHPQITAILGSNDAFAIEVIRAAETIDRRIPTDLSVIGFDDILDANKTIPRLTTMAVDRHTMGRQAVHILHHRLTMPDSCRLMTILRPELRIRESVGDAPAHKTTPDLEPSPAMHPG